MNLYTNSCESSRTSFVDKRLYQAFYQSNNQLDYYSIAGCDKTASICSGRFNNIINSQSFPDIPGTDKMFTTAGTMTKASRL